ncbi:hypothetical protein HOLleu_05108 [Holothuria leucospilota]|uniref:Uncharacterized protein n=1 Tax=Holothuria leucospilota TaxID=206669 RepID=A0A9Q1CJG9_HOLLE|nr:hypothetical protein HOLleu_05108 [Holothuria leucospilota]
MTRSLQTVQLQDIYPNKRLSDRIGLSGKQPGGRVNATFAFVFVALNATFAFIPAALNAIFAFRVNATFAFIFVILNAAFAFRVVSAKIAFRVAFTTVCIYFSFFLTIEDVGEPSQDVPSAVHDNDDDLNSGCSEEDGDDDYTPENDPDINYSSEDSDELNSNSNCKLEDELAEDNGASIAGRQKSSLKINRKNSSSPFVVDCVSRKYCYCPYCDEVQKKLPHHCKKKHDDEVLVAKVSSIPPDNHQLIRQEWLQLRNMGNHKHSTLVYQGEADDLVVHK